MSTAIKLSLRMIVDIFTSAADFFNSLLITSSSFVVCKTATGTHLNETCCVPAAGLLAPTDLSSSADHDVVTDGPIGCSSWFPFDVPAGPSSYSSACSLFLSLQLVHYAPAGSTWPPPDNEQLNQLWTSPLIIQLSFTKKN
ncbi:hypothetical protein F511_42958 [Dorcoceras hygrometricum]|uniref:Uncharacterized protein n=1 Tax=Dorcoceras hygrometricum TaxID=472368 RepID=A0A2Z7BCR3_9LAMI|nr:hypothetical protein F511_42958 [Dorcoceras hygrometricum]